MRLAEGIQAEQAAQGLAEVRVKEADALATEKQGMAAVRVKEAEAAVIEKQGMAQATVLKERAWPRRSPPRSGPGRGLRRPREAARRGRR